MINYQKLYQILTLIQSFPTLGTRDFFNVVSVFCQVFIVTRAKRLSRGFGLRPKGRRCVGLRPTPKIQKPLVPRVVSPFQTMFFFTIHTVCLVPTSQWHYNPVNHKHFSICWQPVYSQKIRSLTNDDDDGS